MDCLFRAREFADGDTWLLELMLAPTAKVGSLTLGVAWKVFGQCENCGRYTVVFCAKRRRKEGAIEALGANGEA